MARAIGLDFGTTNSGIAWVGEDGAPVLARYDSDVGPLETFRSVLYFDRGEDGDGPLEQAAGPAAIERYLAAEDKTGRLVQSLKSFLASRLFHATSIFGSSYRLEDLVALILRGVRERAEEQLGEPVLQAVVGRPVQFVNAKEARDEQLALTRLRAALTNAGFRDVEFEYEPIGAAYHYESTLERDELILIADFGGGTSDFSLVRVGPAQRARPGRRADAILGNAGVPLAGDAFDGKIVRHLVAPLLGRGAEFRSMFDRVLPVPAWLYAHLERWHHLSFLKSPKTMRILLDLRREALEPERIEGLLHLVEYDLGFLLFRAVERAKRELSDQPETRLRFEHHSLVIDEPIDRLSFESWIADEIAAVEQCVDGLLASSGVEPAAVDRVFLTGGSSFVPAVRQIFARRFGEERMRFGGELTSVANGLALRALDEG